MVKTMLMAIALFFGSTVFAQTTVTLANGEWPPYTSRTLPNYGFYSHIISRAFELVDVEVTYEFMPWRRGYISVTNGELDGSLAWTPSVIREKEVFFGEPVYEHTKVVFYNSSIDLKWQTLEDLYPYTIGFINGYSYGDEFDQSVVNKDFKITTLSEDIQAVKMLRAGRIDLFPSDTDVMNWLIANTPEKAAINEIKQHSKPLQTISSSIIVGKKNWSNSQYILKKFNQGLKLLKESGEYDRIVETAQQEYQLD